MTQDVEKPTVLITGASRGLGHATALCFARAGYHVIACSRKAKALETLDDQIFEATKSNATLIPFDLNDPEAFAPLGQALLSRYGHLDALIHCAGLLGVLSPLEDIEPKDFERIIRVNLSSSFRLIQALGPLLMRSKAGRALFITTSPSVVAGRAFWGPYGATKAAMESLVTCWADEIEHTQMRAVLINPGPMRTLMRASAYPGEDPDDVTAPEAIVPMLLEACRTDQAPPLHLAFEAWTPISAAETVI